jgi:hypothetical protein
LAAGIRFTPNLRRVKKNIAETLPEFSSPCALSSEGSYRVPSAEQSWEGIMAIDFIAGITTFFILATITLICAYSDAYHSRRRRRRSFVQDPNKMADANVHLHTRL